MKTRLFAIVLCVILVSSSTQSIAKGLSPYSLLWDVYYKPGIEGLTEAFDQASQKLDSASRKDLKALIDVNLAGEYESKVDSIVQRAIDELDGVDYSNVDEISDRISQLITGETYNLAKEISMDGTEKQKSQLAIAMNDLSRVGRDALKIADAISKGKSAIDSVRNAPAVIRKLSKNLLTLSANLEELLSGNSNDVFNVMRALQSEILTDETKSEILATFINANAQVFAGIIEVDQNIQELTAIPDQVAVILDLAILAQFESSQKAPIYDLAGIKTVVQRDLLKKLSNRISNEKLLPVDATLELDILVGKTEDKLFGSKTVLHRTKIRLHAAPDGADDLRNYFLEKAEREEERADQEFWRNLEERMRREEEEGLSDSNSDNTHQQGTEDFITGTIDRDPEPEPVIERAARPPKRFFRGVFPTVVRSDGTSINSGIFTRPKTNIWKDTGNVTTRTTGGDPKVMEWGRWSGSLTHADTGRIATTEGREGHWIAGTLTPAWVSPPSGSATYKGEVLGTGRVLENTPSGPEKREVDITGKLEMTANFDTYSINGKFHDVNYSGSGVAGTFVDSINFRGGFIGRNAHKGFRGSFSRTGFLGGLDGNFFGGNSSNGFSKIGGSWTLFDQRGAPGSSVASGHGIFHGSR